MAKYDKLQVLETVKETGIVPVFYNAELETSKKVLKACYEGGIRAFEFTNRGDFAHEVFGELVKYANKELPGMIVGVGSIVDPGTAALYIQLGANFVVGPLFNPEIAPVCKVFPGDVLGPAFVKGLRAPMPWSRIMVTGGVKPERENLAGWFGAGVTCVGMGSNLFPKELIASGEWEKITGLCKNALAIVKEVRK